MDEPSIDTCIMELIERIAPIEPSETSSEVDREAFIFLYYLFKDTFLLALDLLDQQCITVYTWEIESTNSIINQYQIFHISLAGNEPHETPCQQYEVRTSVWHCSCPEFTFSAFNKDYYIEWKKPINKKGYWGGLILGQPIPICKHLLACILVEHGGSWARKRVVEKKISKEEFILYTIQ